MLHGLKSIFKWHEGVDNDTMTFNQHICEYSAHKLVWFTYFSFSFFFFFIIIESNLDSQYKMNKTLKTMFKDTLLYGQLELGIEQAHLLVDSFYSHPLLTAVSKVSSTIVLIQSLFPLFSVCLFLYNSHCLSFCLCLCVWSSWWG